VPVVALILDSLVITRETGGGGAGGDLDSRSAIHDVVVRFYREIALDDLLEPVFGQIAEVDWSIHIPTLIDYWCRVLLGVPGYDGAILAAHRHVHDLSAFRVEHFDRWYALWALSVDAGWSGPLANRAKRHGARIARSLARQLLDIGWQPPASLALPTPGFSSKS
jgi:hemoglobin